MLEKFKLNGRKSGLETELVGSSLVGDWRRRLQLAKVRCKIQKKQIWKDCPSKQWTSHKNLRVEKPSTLIYRPSLAWSMGDIRYQHCGKKILKTTPQRHDELHEKMSCMKNELHEKWAARISIKNFTRNEIARTSEFLPPLCIVKCQQKEKKEEQISEWNLFSTTQDSSQLYLLEDLRNRNSLCCNSLHDLRFLPGDLSCIRCSCNSISWLIWHSTPRKIGCAAVIGILYRTAPS